MQPPHQCLCNSDWMVQDLASCALSSNLTWSSNSRQDICSPTQQIPTVLCYPRLPNTRRRLLHKKAALVVTSTPSQPSTLKLCRTTGCICGEFEPEGEAAIL